MQHYFKEIWWRLPEFTQNTGRTAPDSVVSHSAAHFHFSLTTMRLQQRSSLVMFTCDQSRGADGSPGSGRVGAGRVSERDGEAIVPGRGGGQAAALLLRSSHRPIQAGDQKQRREKEEQRRRQVAFSSGHGERGSRLTDIPNRGGRAREQENQVQRCVCVCVWVRITKASSLSRYLEKVGGNKPGGEKRMSWCWGWVCVARDRPHGRMCHSECCRDDVAYFCRPTRK